MMSRFILYSLSFTFSAYKKDSLPSAMHTRHSTLHHRSSVELLPSFTVPILCMHEESGEQASGTVVCICDTYLRVRAIRFLGSVAMTAHYL
jgi:hypothetical protein